MRYKNFRGPRIGGGGVGYRSFVVGFGVFRAPSIFSPEAPRLGDAPQQFKSRYV